MGAQQLILRHQSQLIRLEKDPDKTLAHVPKILYPPPDLQQEMENQYNQSTSFSTIEVLLKDINQHIPIILIK